jgi:hypothetical protein
VPWVKKYRSDGLAAVQETALGLTEAGVMDKRTMKAFDEMCLTPVKELTAEQVRQTLAREGEPGCVCPLPQRDHRARQPVGSAARNIPAAPRSSHHGGRRRDRVPSVLLMLSLRDHAAHSIRRS